jgi:hypothetical protein
VHACCSHFAAVSHASHVTIHSFWRLHGLDQLRVVSEELGLSLRDVLHLTKKCEV